MGPANGKAATPPEAGQACRSTPYALAVSVIFAGIRPPSLLRAMADAFLDGTRKFHAILRNEPELYDISNCIYLTE
jgi:hypothetical protein